ncbi:MAG: chemotaxis protein CheD [Deltaproteobacteria bacterium]|nr:chemotaxis protein CheD [Deltaproteobacteria bacterium]
MKDYLKKQVTIKIGELYATDEPTVIYTLLGSCVAVCIYDQKKHIGGMNHIFLPGNNKSDSSTRYGENAIKYLIKNICQLGGERDNLIAKAFGGAHVIPAISKGLGIGPKIVDFVINYLKKEGIEIIAHDFGGNKTRKVYFHTDTGMVYVKLLTAKNAVMRT